MFIIRNVGEGKAGLSPEQHLAFVKACEVYIEKLTARGSMISAHPMMREGKMISGTPGNFTEGPYTNNDEQIVGYYRILAGSLDEAVDIAKQNPEFAYSKNAKIEVRPLKMKEETTAFVYPK